MVKYNPQIPLFNEAKKKARNDIAKIYRTIRKENPTLSRLLYKRYIWCEKELNKTINGSPS